jgi:hypothetical protein
MGDDCLHGDSFHCVFLGWIKRKPRMAGMPGGLEREDSFDLVPVLC